MVSLADFDLVKNPCNENDFLVKNEAIVNNDECFNILSIHFPIGLPPVLAERIYVLYDSSYKVVRYITIENKYGEENSYCFCETTTLSKRSNYGNIPNDDNIIKAKLVEIWNIKPLCRDDFKIYGLSTKDAVKDTKDRCLLKHNNFVWTYGNNDDISTFRGVMLHDDKQKVFDLYGISKLDMVDLNDDIIYSTLYGRYDNQLNGDFSSFDGSEMFCDYIYNDMEKKGDLAVIRFYFGSDEKVKLIGFIGRSFDAN